MKQNIHSQLHIENMVVAVTHKPIKHLYIRVYRPSGDICVSAPFSMRPETIRAYILKKRHWISQQRQSCRRHPKDTHKRYRSQEKHYYLGKQYRLRIIEKNAFPRIAMCGHTIEMHVRPNTPCQKKEALLDAWYRQRLKEIIPAIIRTYEAVLAVRVHTFGIKKMKTRWGTCNINTKKIWLNLELVKREKHLIAYVVAHEMIHLLERTHNKQFVAYMDNVMPQWRLYQAALNRAPHLP